MTQCGLILRMGGSSSTDSPLAAAAGAAGPEVTDAFELLSNETRMAILLALWEAYEPGVGDNPVSFSELRDRVGMRDSGQFNYHLDKLTGQYVAEIDGGYILRDAGLKIVRAVIAGAGLDDASVAPTELDVACTRCGERSVNLRYQSGAIYLTCDECEGILTAEKWPQGTIAVWEFDPAGLYGREPDELRAAAGIRNKHAHQMMEEGVCPACSGPIETSLQLCSNHTTEPGEVCPNCGTRDSARIRHICAVCKNWDGNPVEVSVFNHPAVISFYYERGVDTRLQATEVAHYDRVEEIIRSASHTLVSSDPVRIRVSVLCRGDELQLTLDEDLAVIDIEEQAQPKAETDQ